MGTNEPEFRYSWLNENQGKAGHGLQAVLDLMEEEFSPGKFINKREGRGEWLITICQWKLEPSQESLQLIRNESCFLSQTFLYVYI